MRLNLTDSDRRAFDRARLPCPDCGQPTVLDGRQALAFLNGDRNAPAERVCPKCDSGRAVDDLRDYPEQWADAESEER